MSPNATPPVDCGGSIIMFGLNAGASVVPFAVSFAWERGAGPLVLPATIMASHLLPIPCQYLIRRFTVVPVTVTWKLAVDSLLRRGDRQFYDGAGGALDGAGEETEGLLSGGGGGGEGGGGAVAAASDHAPEVAKYV